MAELIFREVFDNEFNIRQRGGVPTAVSLSDGVGSFNGTSSKINYFLNLNGTYSVRVKCNLTDSASTFRYLFDCRGGNNDGTGYIYTDKSTGNVEISSGTSYINGLAETSRTVGVSQEIVISGITLNQGTGSNLSLIGARFSDNFQWLGTMDLFEIYEGTLTASEISNLYNGIENTEPNTTKLIDFDGYKGVIKDRTGLNTLSSTAMKVVRNGSHTYPEFDGSSSKVDCGSDFIGTKAVTVTGWIKQYSTGETGNGTLISNGKFRIRNSINDEIFLVVTSDGSTIAYSATSYPPVIGVWQFIAVAREEDGTVSFYLGDKNKAPFNIDGSINSGTPVAGDNNVIIGNLDNQTTTFDGLINLKVHDGILSLAEICRCWSSSRWRYV